MKRFIVCVVLVLFSGGAQGKSLLPNGHAIAAAHKECVREVGRPFPQYAAQIFSDTRLRFVGEILEQARTRAKEEIISAYRARVLSRDSVENGIVIGAVLQKDLVKARKKYGVVPYDILAILRAETDFGYVLGDVPVVNTLYTKCVGNPNKRKFAIRELREFLSLSRKHGWDPFEVKGSRSGAFGYTQFIPTSFGAYAVDGDGDGKIDLFSYPDAIASTANYLARHGYLAGSREARRTAFLRYNPWGVYADTLLEYSERVQLLYVRAVPRRPPLS